MNRAIWGHLWTDAEREGGPDRIVRRCKDAGIGSYLTHTYPIASNPRGYYSPGVTYNTTVFQAETHDLLTPLLEAARREGTQAEPWLLPFVTELLRDEKREDLFPRRAYQSAEFASRPAGETVDGATKDGKVLCPTWPENRARAIVILSDLIEQHGTSLTGIDLDMVRYPNADVSWEHPCHCEACRSKYRELFGKESLTRNDLEQPGVAYRFTRFRNDCIAGMVEEIRDITHRAGLRLTMSARADFFGAAVLEGQDWVRWAREGLVDVVFTMNYSTDLEAHGRNVQQHAGLMQTQDKAAHYDGIGRSSSMGENSMDQVLQLARDALDAGVDGVSIFHYNAMDDQDFARLKELP